MNSELIDAVKERIAIGHTKEHISDELRSIGYDEEEIARVLVVAAGESSEATAVISSAVSSQSSESVSLPPFRLLCKESLQYACRKWFLVGSLLAVFFSLMVALGVGVVVMSFKPLFGLVWFVIVGLAGFVFFMMFALAMQRIVVTDDAGGSTPLQVGWSWVRQHFFWSGLGVLVLFMLITQGAGLALIPYIVIGPFISFMVLAFIIEGYTGLATVFRARELGRGNWWELLWRKMLLMVVIVLPIAVVLLLIVLYLASQTADLSTLPEVVVSTYTWQVYVGFFLLLTYTVFATVWMQRFNALLFRHLIQARPPVATSGTGVDSWKYVLLILLGIASLFMQASEEGQPPVQSDNWMDMGNEEQNIDATDYKQRAKELRKE